MSYVRNSKQNLEHSPHSTIYHAELSKAVSCFENLDIATYQKILRSKFPKNRSKIEIRLVVFLTPLLLPCITGDCCKVGALNNSNAGLTALDSSI